ncbi:hypothetical protein C365_01373, partial [Cryptococcus neoformans Bt85]
TLFSTHFLNAHHFLERPRTHFTPYRICRQNLRRPTTHLKTCPRPPCWSASSTAPKGTTTCSPSSLRHSSN